MNRKQRRASNANGLKMQRREWNEFECVTHKAQSLMSLVYHPDQCWLNNHYSVQVFLNREQLGMKCTKLMIRRNDSKPIYDWPALQRIKNEICGEDKEGFQMFPKESELIDQANLYWMFVINA